jgi:hypothetical protein
MGFNEKQSELKLQGAQACGKGSEISLSIVEMAKSAQGPKSELP